jgi:A/G-specific adenine glycosylase
MNTAADQTGAQQHDDARWFQSRVLDWFSMHGRAFVWRHQHDPYAILLAELMLHRTQARQVEPIYLRFLERFPTLQALAVAEEAEVLQMLAPLGLGWRLAKIMPMARLLVDRYSGEVPCDRDALLSLPGVGPYVADAVRVLAFDEPGVFIDTNTVRVAGRYFGFPTHAESRRRRPVREAIARLIDQRRSRESNLALLDLAALLCHPGRPLCDQCPVLMCCRYGSGSERLSGAERPS